MPKFNVKLLLLLFIASYSFKAFSQATTFDYTNAGLGSACNVFNPFVKITNHNHDSYAGGVLYTAGQGLKLTTKPGNNPTEGTGFQIEYDFIPGRTYTISMTAKGDGIVTGYLCVIPNNNQFPYTASGACGTDPKVSSYSLVGYGRLSSTPPSSGSAVTATTPQFSIPGSTVYSTLMVWASGGQGALDALTISSIVINDVTPVSASVSILPATVSKACGTALSPTTFTATPSNLSGTVSYSWNLGTSGYWKYNGTAVTTPVSTGTTASITLTADACVNTPPNIVVTASNGTSSPTATATLTQPAFSVNGAASICNSSGYMYTINNLNCSANVTWNISPAGIVTPTSGTGNSITLTKVGNGTITVQATIANACGGATVTKTQTVAVGTPAPTFNVALLDNSQCMYKRFEALSTSNGSSATTGYNWYINNALYAQHGYKIRETFPSNSTTIGLSITTSCGTSTITNQTFNCETGFAVSLNTASGRLSILSQSGFLVKEVKIIDQVGNNKLTYKNLDGAKQLSLDISHIPSGIYTFTVYDGHHWQAQQISLLK